MCICPPPPARERDQENIWQSAGGRMGGRTRSLSWESDVITRKGNAYNEHSNCCAPGRRRQADRNRQPQTRQAGRQADRQTDTQLQTDRYRDRQTEI